MQATWRQVATRIEIFCACESIQIEYKQFQESMDEIIHAMSVVLEIMDSYTAGHQRRVVDVAHAISREMKLPRSTVIYTWFFG